MNPKLRVQQVGKRFGGVVALEDVSFDVAAGSLHAVCGENGAGKSTLMKILSGVLTDYEGTVTLDGQVVRFADTRAAEAAGVAIIHQELNLVDNLSAAANVFLGRELTGPLGSLRTAAMERAAEDLFRRLECSIDPRAGVGGLRVGDQQLVEIAKALSRREAAGGGADILIMDEPTSALTESEAERLFRVVERLRQEGTTVLYISHKMEEVFRLADAVTVLRDGRHVRTAPRDSVRPSEVVALMVGRELADSTFSARSPGKVVLSVNGLTLSPPRGRDRLRDVSLDLRAGEVVGVAGLMGAGRTELLECLFGASVVVPTGSMRLDGREVRFGSPREAVAAGVAMVTEDRKRLGLLSQMNVRENITASALASYATGGVVNGRQERAAAEEGRTSLSVRCDSVEAAVGSLSGGNQQKCVIARWLQTKPRVLLLDDPTRGVDVGAKAELYAIIDRLCREERLAILVTSSELPELITLCDRILVLREGRLTGEVSREEFSEERILSLAT